MCYMERVGIQKIGGGVEITSVEMRPSFRPTMPYSSDSATRQPRAIFSVKAYAAKPAQITTSGLDNYIL